MKLFKTTIANFFVLLIFILGLSFFAFPQSADACDVKKGSSTRFRTGFGTQINQPEDFFSDEDNPPFLYVDIDTEDCEETDTITLSIWGITAVLTGGGVASDFNIPGEIFGSLGVFSYPINIGNANPDDQGRFTVALRVGSELCFGNNDPYDCLIMGAIYTDPGTILALFGNALANLNQADAQFFLQKFAPSDSDLTPSGLTGSECLSQGTDVGLYYQQSLACAGLYPFNGYSGGYFSSAFDEELRTYYNNYPNLNIVSNPPLNPPQHYVFSEDTESGENEFRIAIPGIRFKCPGITSCGDSEWDIPEQPFIPYGQNYPGEGPSIVDPLPSNYQEEYIPLADLPFEGLNGGPTPSLGEYLASIFRMAIVVIVILAVLMIVYHGVAYATTGAVGKKDDHRKGVGNAILGLVLALGSWLLLNTISPRLASQLSIGIPEVNLDGDAESISTSGSTDTNGTITAFTLPTNMGFYCPGSGGSTEIPSIIDSFNNKVTYRWGGKGGSLPSGGKFKLSPNEQNSGGYMCTNDSGQSIPCRNFCPLESVCLDCSGFVNHVRQCAGMSIYAGTTSMVTNSSAIAIDMKTLSSDGKSITINGSNYNLQPGDILVWKGHVVIYYGNGIIAESKGDLASIKNKNKNIKKTNLAQSNYKKKITHLIKANP